MAEAAAEIAAVRHRAIQSLGRGNRSRTQTARRIRFSLGRGCRLPGHLELQAAHGNATRDMRVPTRASRSIAASATGPRARTLSGPHRSDLEVIHGPKGMPAKMCSTGEQKALLVGLVLAQARLVKQVSGGVSPLILLDEIAAHLDAERRRRCFASIASLNAQVWMTGTDSAIFAPLRDVSAAQFFLVSDGAFTPVNGAESGSNP